METVKISVEYQATLHQDGLVKVWNWKEGGEMNTEHICKTPIWEILNSENLYKILTEQTIELPAEFFHRYFDEVQ